MRRLLAGLVLTLGFLTATVKASYGIDENAKAGYFNYEGQYVFAMNPTANGDIYFHMSAPATHCWIGGGFGTQMKDALMFVAYPAADGFHLTVSARIGTGHTEPTHDPTIEIFGIHNDTYAPNAMTKTDSGTLIVHGACRNCTTWSTGALDFESTEQPMLFALGPSCSLQTDALDASIPLHQTFGRYTINMLESVNATGWYGRVPGPNIPDFVYPPTDSAFVSSWTSLEFDVHHMKDWKAPLHAALMCLAFLLVFPAGSLALILLKKVLIHAALQVLGVVFVIAGLGLGITVSRDYNKSRHFNSTHQGIGLLVVAALLIQLSLGIFHHAFYVKTKEPTIFGKVHFFLGPIIMILGVVNGGIGFHFAARPSGVIAYSVVTAIVAVVFFGIIGCLMCFRQRRKYRPESDGPVQPQLAQVDEQPGVPAAYHDFEMQRSPTFGSQPPEAYEPTTPYSPNFDSPYTPISAYTPASANTWKKEEVTAWSASPYAWKPQDFK